MSVDTIYERYSSISRFRNSGDGTIFNFDKHIDKHFHGMFGAFTLKVYSLGTYIRSINRILFTGETRPWYAKFVKFV